MQGLRGAQKSYDRQLPVDVRTDAQIEQDAADRANEKRYQAHLAEILERSRNRQHLWDAVDAKRLAQKF